MKEVQPGDLVFSYCDTLIKAIGVVQQRAVTAPKPNFRTAGSNWSDIGWYVEVEFSEINQPIRPKEFMDRIRPLLAEKYAPLQSNGNGLQGIYLTEISTALGELLILLSRANLEMIQKEFAPISEEDSAYEAQLEIEGRKIDGELERIQLSKSRRGQGIFRANVRLVESYCRVTGVSNMKHLRASHIKPWAASNDEEKLDGFNGLLMSPHVDHLFDRGFISFRDSGEILVSKELNRLVLEQWSIRPDRNVGEFRKGQFQYLDYHRDLVFQS
jgi:hypothetical protein